MSRSLPCSVSARRVVLFALSLAVVACHPFEDPSDHPFNAHLNDASDTSSGGGDLISSEDGLLEDGRARDVDRSDDIVERDFFFFDVQPPGDVSVGDAPSVDVFEDGRGDVVVNLDARVDVDTRDRDTDATMDTDAVDADAMDTDTSTMDTETMTGSCANPCGDNAVCVNATCECSPPYAGDGVECRIPLTESTPYTWADGERHGSCLGYFQATSPYNAEALPNGEYQLESADGTAAVVYCDMNYEGGGWTVLRDEYLFDLLEFIDGGGACDMHNGGQPQVLKAVTSGGQSADCAFVFGLFEPFNEVRALSMGFRALSNENHATELSNSSLTMGDPSCGLTSGDIFVKTNLGLVWSVGARNNAGLCPASTSYAKGSVVNLNAAPQAASGNALVVHMAVGGTESEGWRWEVGELWVR